MRLFGSQQYNPTVLCLYTKGVGITRPNVDTCDCGKFKSMEKVVLALCVIAILSTVFALFSFRIRGRTLLITSLWNIQIAQFK